MTVSGLAGQNVFPGEGTSQRRRNAQDRNHAIGYQKRRHLFGLGNTGDADAVAGVQPYILKTPVLLAKGEIHGWRVGQFLDIYARRR